MKLLPVTMYEILGYIFPGTFGSAGVYLIFWTFLLMPDQDWTASSERWWGVLLVVVYVFGHFLQAIMNQILAMVNAWQPECRAFNDLTEEMQSVLQKEVREAVGVEAQPVDGKQSEGKKPSWDPKLFYDIADHYVLQHGKTETRDVYVYREGFYRGMTPGLLLFGLGCLFRMHGTRASLNVSGTLLVLQPWVLFWTGVIAIATAAWSFERFRRFAGYKINYAFYSFLIGIVASRKAKVGSKAQLSE
jgi:hypothetical protein